MKKNVTIAVDGKEYPCRQTMGAMLRFKKETGKEVTEIDGTSLSELCIYLWCCVMSASKHDGADFSMSLQDFSDALSPDDLTAWSASLADNGTSKEANGEERGEKKS